MQFIIPALLPPQYELAMSQQKSGGALVSFEIKDPTDESAQARAWKIIDNMTLFSRTGNLGDTRSTVTTRNNNPRKS